MELVEIRWENVFKCGIEEASYAYALNQCSRGYDWFRLCSMSLSTSSSVQDMLSEEDVGYIGYGYVRCT